ncbi:hypothetical protein HUK65_06410 [Rhodobacteraceae bacterium 2376]|uniref:Nucleotide-diphospho-sugar transferase domain-containing protein n=2 Tax=Rhabdonatronobacter sediminivivens TaxID=2743469 RepID=A0A7Z0KXS0_9RHOB|nr:hypothetical protein [Rhabdonatronobacter sediminivivens]
MTAPDAGVVYVARGAGYLDLAVASARTLRAQHDALPIDLYTDQPAPGGLFDQVHPLPPEGQRDKIACMARSRFDRTLFLDCDTLVLAPLADLFRLLDRFDLAVAHDVRRASRLIRQGDRYQLPYAFPQFNTGVLLYRHSSAMAAFFDAWGAAWVAQGGGRDQPAFRDLLWDSDLRYHVLAPEYNMRRLTVLDAAEPADLVPVILHSHRLLQHLRQPGAPRVQDLATLLELERAALAQEWAAHGRAVPIPAGEDPAERFRASDEGAP